LLQLFVLRLRRQLLMFAMLTRELLDLRAVSLGATLPPFAMEQDCSCSCCSCCGCWGM
jgi:hypothetical protein